VTQADPSPEELAAVVAAIEVAWPRPVVVVAAQPARSERAWRWSGRWWAPRRVAAERQRPY
jgi:hypothetical protein